MPATHANDLKQTYAQVVKGYEKRNSGNLDIESLEEFSNLLSLKAKVLDLGAGIGRDAAWLADKGYEMTLFDLSPEMLEIAKQRIPTATIVQGDMTQMKFEDKSFDGVWASASLLHLTKSECSEVLQKIFAMVNSKGVFYCSLKEGEGEVEIEDDKYGKPMKRFFSFYSLEELKDMVEMVGFEIKKAKVWQASSGQKWIKILAIKN